MPKSTTTHQTPARNKKTFLATLTCPHCSPITNALGSLATLIAIAALCFYSPLFF